MTTHKPSHILIAVDGSEHALAGVQMVKDMPLDPNTIVTLMTVFLPRNASNYKDYELNLSQAKEMLAEKQVILKEELVSGIAAETISFYAGQNNVDLIVMGALGMRATIGILLGGVAQQVVEYAQRPVLVMRAPYHKPNHTLLVSDGSTCSDKAVDYLAQFPLPEHSSIDLLHVLPPPPIPQTVMVAYAWPVTYATSEAAQTQEQVEIAELLKAERVQGEIMLAETEHRLRAMRPDLTLKSVLLRGDAATEILDYTRINHIDLIIAGSRGLSQVKSWLLGSVSRKLLHYAPCSVLVVRGLPGCSVLTD